MARLQASLAQAFLIVVLGAALAASACIDQEGGSGPDPNVIGGHSREQWQARARSLERQREALEARIERARDERFDQDIDYSSQPQSAGSIYSRQEESNQRDAAARSRVELLETQLDQLEDQISRFEADARHRGVPADWLR